MIAVGYLDLGNLADDAATIVREGTARVLRGSQLEVSRGFGCLLAARE